MENFRIGMKSISMKATTLLMVFFLALAGCSTKAERTDYKDGAGKGRPLDMPPDLVLPKGEGKYVVPEGGSATSATYSEYARSGATQGETCTCQDAAAAQPASAAVAVPKLPPKLLDRADGSKSILIAEPFDRCWLRVSQALDRAAIVVDDKDRSKGLLYLKGGNSQLSVQAKAAEPGKAESCEVSASNASGAATDDSKRIIDTLYKSLGR